MNSAGAARSLTGEKLAQAAELARETGLDVWLVFVRETANGGDPALPLILSPSLTWQSALLVTPGGRRVAIVGSYDAEPVRASGEWTEVIPYVEGIREPLLEALEDLVPSDRAAPRIGVNFSASDDKADGLTHGLYLLLAEYLRGSRFEGSLESAEPLVVALRGRKTTAEVERMRHAIAATDALFEELAAFVRVGMTEREIFEFLHLRIREKGLGFAWEPSQDPIVNSGPDSMIGHGLPSEVIQVSPGHLLHVDLGVTWKDYSSDLQRCWYVPDGQDAMPRDLQQALEAVTGAISAGAAALRPGVAGWEVDSAARRFLQEAGYPEYLHALGHQVGRKAHDGGGILGPRWERYGQTPLLPVEKGQVFTLELGAQVEGRGYLGLEEMVLVTETGCEWLSSRQLSLPALTFA